jgi:hemin uptake protein HemP
MTTGKKVMKMNRKRPHIIFVFPVIMLLLCNSCQRYNDENDFIVQILNDKTVTIIGYKWTSKDVRIPPRIGGRLVTKIGENAFQGENVFQYKKIISVIIPNSVTYIGKNAFRGNELISVIIPDSVIHIEEGAFYNNKLTDIRIPKRMTVIGGYVFAYNKLAGITIPDNVTRIGRAAFSDNELTNVIIPDSVTYIGRAAFMNNRLTEIIIPKNIAAIEDSVFKGNKLTCITIPESVISIGDNAFSHNELIEITIPKNVRSIGRFAFYSDYFSTFNDIIKVTIGENVEFKYGAFKEFDSFYNETVLKRGGTYIYNNYHWSPEGITFPVYRFKSNSGLKFSDVLFFADMPDLEYIYMDGNYLLTDITPLSELTKLRELHITSCPNIESLEPLSSLTNLKSLYLEHNDNYDYSALIPLRQLESLEIYSGRYYTGEIDLSHIGQLYFLKKFSIGKYHRRSLAKFTNINALQNLVNLERLEIYCIDNLDLSIISGLRSLTELELRSCPINDISPLANLPNLVNITLTDTKIRDITPLLNSNSIKRIEIITYDFDRVIEDDILSQFARKNIQLALYSVDTEK